MLLALLFAGGALLITDRPAVASPQTAPASFERATTGELRAGESLRVKVDGAEGAKTVIGQLTVADAQTRGFITAYACGSGLPTGDFGKVARSDLNFDGTISPISSNRLFVQADAAGDICFYTSAQVEMIVDINAVTFDTGVTSFPNRRTDTRTTTSSPSAGDVLRVNVKGAEGAKTVIGQLTVAQAGARGFVTAYGCDAGLPRGDRGEIVRSDLNYDGQVNPIASNRLMVQADSDGDVCFYSSAPVEMIVDINGTSDIGIASFPNRRTDTRTTDGRVVSSAPLRVKVEGAQGSKTVIGQLTVARTEDRGFVTAYACDDGPPSNGASEITRSDLNFDGRISPVASNRLLVQADSTGSICFYTSTPADMVVDINAVSDTGITSFANRRTDTRTGQQTPTEVPTNSAGVPQWPAYTIRPPLNGVAALTGRPAPPSITNRPITAVKIDNYRLARPHYGLDSADAVIEVNAEGVSRFIALFHTHLPPEVGPVRSARTTDINLLTAMNHPIFAYSGSNPGVSAWISSAASANLVTDLGAQRNGCYRREASRPGPHNLLLGPACANSSSPSAGPAQSLWAVDPAWTPPAHISSRPDTTVDVAMDGVRVSWAWNSGASLYLRSQDDAAHLTSSGQRIGAANVVVIETPYVPSIVDARSPHAVSVGSGRATIHRDGLAISATWTRASPYDPYRFSDPDTGSAVPLDSGTTYLELVRASP